MNWPNEANGVSVQRVVDVQGFLALERSGLDTITQWQALRIGELLDWLADHVPWWRSRLSVCTGLKDWHQLRPMTRFDLRQLVAINGAASVPPHHGAVTVSHLVAATTVSNRYFTSEWFQRMCKHAVYADHLRQSRNPFATHAVIADDVPLHTGDHVVVEASQIDGTGVQALRNFELFTTEQHISWIAQHKPTILTVCPDWFETALVHAVARKQSLPEIQQILTYGATATDSLRRKARKWLGASVRHRYTRPECGPIAFQCPGHESFLHVSVGNVLVEVVDDKETPLGQLSVGEGSEAGRVLVTSLHNYSMPLLRYDTGDRAILHATCPGCGLAIPSLSALRQDT
jgi:phenylacetate-CoA ligase